MKPALTKKQDKALDARISEIFRKHCSYMQIPMMEILTIYKKAKEAYVKGDDMTAAIIDYVNRIRIN